MTDLNLEPAELSKRGVAAARAGRNDEAREYLLAAVEADEHNEQAWLWLGGLMPEVEDQIVCLENALTLNPDNEPAQRKLKQLYAKRGTPPSDFSPAGLSGDARGPGASFAAPPTATQDLYLSSPSATQTLAQSPFGASPWDVPTSPSTGDTSSLPASRSDYGAANPWANSSTADPELFAPPAATSHYSSGGHPEQGGTDWQQPASEPADSAFGYTPAHKLEEHLPRYSPGGFTSKSSSTERGALDNYNFTSSPAPSTVNPFLSPNATVGYSSFDQASTTASSQEPRHYEPASDFAYAADASTEHDERLDCPYCGWQTRIEDQHCPNCSKDLYLSVLVNESRSASVLILFALWLARAFYGGAYLFLSITLLNFLNSALAGGNLSTASKYGLTVSSINQGAHNAVLTLVIIYGIQIGVSLVMAFGSLARIRIFYYLNMIVLGLLALLAIYGFAIDPTKSPIGLLIGLALLAAQFVLLVRCEPDFIPQRQRIVEPAYRGEASATGFYNLGSRYQKAGFTALAAKTWRRAVGMSPGDLRIRMALAVAYNKMKRYDLSQEQLTEALRIDANDIRALNLMAIVKVRLGNYDEARHYLETALQIKPDDPDTLDNKQLIEQEIKKAEGKQEPKPAAQQTKKAGIS
jgi:tetratricopeptide (TPR) repeat protein